MATSLRLKYGTVEFEYHGDLQIEKADMLELLETMSRLAGRSGKTNGGSIGNDDFDSGAGDGESSDVEPVGSVSDIAHRLEVKNGPDLVTAAAASLHFLNHMVQFTNRDLSKAMREAKAYSKPSYFSHLSEILTRLVKGNVLRSLGGERYALSADTIKDLKNRLG